MPEVNPNIKTMEQAIFAGVMRAAAYIYREQNKRAETYLATRFPSMPYDEIQRVIDFAIQARKAGISFTKGGKPTIPAAKGIFMRTEKKVIYSVFQPVVEDDGKRRHGKTDVTAIWSEEP